jgi:hypothetical protein
MRVPSSDLDEFYLLVKTILADRRHMYKPNPRMPIILNSKVPGIGVAGGAVGVAVALVNETKNAVGSPPLFTERWIVFRPATNPLLIVNAVGEPKQAKHVVAAGALEFTDIEPSLSVPKVPLMDAVVGSKPVRSTTRS